MGISLPQNAVHVWRLRLDEVPLDRQVLSTDEIARAERFQRTADRDHYIAGRGALRSIRGGYLGSAPGAVRFRYGAQGKPELCTGRNAAPGFSLTNAAGRALVAVAEGHSVGIDLERLRDDLPLMDVATAWFVPTDVDLLRSLDNDEQRQTFFRFWTRREAYGKLLGTGLTERVDFSLNSENAGTNYRFVDLAVDDGFVASLCVIRSAGPVTLRRWPDEDVSRHGLIGDMIP